MDQQISHGSTTGIARSITMTGGIPFLNVYTGTVDGTPRYSQIDFLRYLADRGGTVSSNNTEETTPGNSTNNTNNTPSGDGDDE